ncbi:MAG: dihydroorotate dehydrogenase [Lactobacillus mulieris]|uniref:Dihydroorotate dehydrogenase n=1 Tax=Lactobacillus mulieris TaxID=2508708 RepID=A0AAP3GYJ5_9LACO|nr:dihydroorotate dehydrogenase [Lactobacillus mulieris]MCF1784335.1 dihydroorotate dehydrogenase [Lactobacillus mulieris]MCT7674251.1 dihydroorotate dehydrogenase [Lactobacillus mulieris]MCT7772658.1 dihydroorotate dehydrogenase [Lactobacillus mulieris]MCW8104822.1 dihydroorotate dehydrogenase [Lactobacillus mulieris]MCZ3845448.1 dihydroorotate dehydrogenase [Lactobacillus mulieris]
MTNISVELPGLKLKNPLMPASGTFGFGDLPEKFNYDEMGAMVLKTTTPKEGFGNPKPQFAIYDDGVMNSVGLTNPGVDVVAGEKIPYVRKKHPDLPIIASVGGASVEDYALVAKKLDQAGANALEINISCPNVDHGGLHFGTEPDAVHDLVAAVKKEVKAPIYVKLTPNVTDIMPIAKAAKEAGTDGFSVTNTVLGLRFDIKTGKAVLGKGQGGWSGKAIMPIAIRLVYQLRQLGLPIIGMGGIETAEDVVEFMEAGASAVAVGSAHFKDALAIPHIVSQLPKVLSDLGINDINDLGGKAKI